MKISCLLEGLDNNVATIYDYTNKNTYTITLNAEQKAMYSDLLQEANQEVVNENGIDEQALPIVIYDTDLETLVFE